MKVLLNLVSLFQDLPFFEIKRLLIFSDKCLLKMSSFLPAVSSIIERQKIPFHYITPTPADGNCFFHAVVDQLQRPDVLGTVQTTISACQTHTLLRKNVIAFIKSNAAFRHSEQFEALQVAALQQTGCVSLSIYLQQMSLEGSWADTLMIQSTASFLCKDISLAIDTRPTGKPWETFFGGPNFTRGRAPTLTLAHLDQSHFQSLHPLPEQMSCRGCGKQVKNLHHISRKSDCKAFYENDKETQKDMQACFSCKKLFKSLNMHLARSETCRKAHGWENQENFSQQCVKDKKERYSLSHAQELKDKKAVYNKAHSPQIRERQAAYDKAHSAQIRERQAAYDKAHSPQIRESHAE